MTTVIASTASLWNNRAVRGRIAAAVLALALALAFGSVARAHGVSRKDASFVESIQAPRSARSSISAPSTWSPATTTCCSWSA